jgi:hypothetical protein
MKKIFAFIIALALAIPVFAQHRPPTWNHRPPTWNHRPPTWNHRPPTWNHRPPTWQPGWGWGPRPIDLSRGGGSPVSPWRHSSTWGWWQPVPSSVQFRSTMGVFSVSGFVWSNVRYVPPAPFNMVHPPHPQTVVVIPEGAFLIVDDSVVIVSSNGRLTVYRAEVNGQ